MNDMYRTPKADLTSAASLGKNYSIAKMNGLGILGLFLLTPIFIEALDYFSAVKSFIQFYGDPKNMAGLVSATIVSQIRALILLIPGLVLCSVIVFKFKFNPKWYFATLRVYGLLSIFIIPVFVFVGFYIYFLSNRHRRIYLRSS